MEKVLQTIELLERILLQLSFRDLLLARRVCRHFAQKVNASILLRRKFYLAPEPNIGQIVTINPAFEKDISDSRLHTLLLPRWLTSLALTRTSLVSMKNGKTGLRTAEQVEVALEPV